MLSLLFCIFLTVGFRVIMLSKTELLHCYQHWLHFLLLLPLLLFPQSAVSILSQKMNPNHIPWLTCSWVDSDDTITISLPGTVADGYAGRTLHLTNTLPVRFFDRPSLMIRTSEQRAAVHLNGIPIYEFVPGDPQRAPGSMYHFISLPSGYEGGRLDIFLSSPLNQFSGVANEVRIGSITAHILYILKQGSIGLFLAVVAIMLGFIMLAFYLSMYFSGSRHPSILYLALFVILSGCWMCSESRALECSSKPHAHHVYCIHVPVSCAHSASFVCYRTTDQNTVTG